MSPLFIEENKVTGYAPLPDGGRIAYDIGPPAPHRPIPLLLHRPLAGPSALWGPFRGALSQHLRVISFDPRGIGKSSDALALTTTRTMADDARALLDHLGVSAAHVFGLSLGGMVAARLAIDAPDRVARLVLASTAARGIVLSASGAVRGVELAGCLASRSEDVEVCLARRVLSRRFRREHAADVHRIEALIQRSPASRLNLLRLLAAVARHDVRAELHRIHCETLVLAASDDPLLDVDTQAALARRFPHARFDVIDSSGHDMSLEQPLATAARVAEFLLGGG